MSNPDQKKTPKKNKKPAAKKPEAPATVTIKYPIPPAIVHLAENGRSIGYVGGDVMQTYELPNADRAALARHLVMVAGNVLATKGDEIDGATIVVLTKRKKPAS